MVVADGGSARIAVVSANALFLHQLHKLLAGRPGYELCAVDEWNGADQAVAVFQPDVVVVDMSGDDEAARMVLEGLARNGATRHTPVVAMVGADRIDPLPVGSGEEVVLDNRFSDLLRRFTTVLAIHQRPALDAAAA